MASLVGSRVERKEDKKLLYYFLDGQAEPASSFGEESTSGHWVPKACKDDLTFGTNGYFIEVKNAPAF